MQIGLTGASGFLGRALLEQARPRNHQVVAFSRNRAAAVPGADRVDVFGPDMTVEYLDAIVHLAGESILGLWTPQKRERIMKSRVEGTRWVVNAIGKTKNRPKALVCASGISIYGDRGDAILTEKDPPGPTGFLRDVSIAWEEEARKAERWGVRVVMVRVALVLGRKGGALPLMATPFRFGLGGVLGSGQQWMPWVHLTDIAALFLFAAETDQVSGPLIGSSPNPVRNRDFIRILGQVVHRPTILPVPENILRTLLREESSLLLDSERTNPEKALQAGFTFRYPDLASALREALG